MASVLTGLDVAEYRSTKEIARRAGLSWQIAAKELGRMQAQHPTLLDFHLVVNPRSPATRTYEWRLRDNGCRTALGAPMRRAQRA